MINELIANFSLLTAFLFFLNPIIRRQEAGLQPQPLTLQTKVFIGVTHGLFSIVLMFFSVPVTSTISAIILGIGCGLIAKVVGSYWLRWTLSLLVSVTLIIITSYYLLGRESFGILPYALSPVLMAGIFLASLIACLTSSNKMQLELKRSEERYRSVQTYQDAVFNSATGVAIIATDIQGNVTLFNKGSEVLLGYKAEEVIGKVSPEIFHDNAELTERRMKLSRQFNRSITVAEIFTLYAEHGETNEQEWTFIRKDGRRLTVNLSISLLISDGKVLGNMCVATDITKRKKAEEELRRANEILKKLSMQDGLTGFSNRRHFDEALEHEWLNAQKECTSLSLILFDIDYFKNYNDSYGHQAGDECLKTVATMLKGMIQRESDIYARYGGEEFALILPDTDIERATGIAELVRLAIEACAIPNAESQVSEVITISAGVATVNPDTMLDFKALVAEADTLLYIAKQEGRNRVKASTGESYKV